MTRQGPDAMLDARLQAFFAARAELVAAEAPGIDEVIAELDRRVRQPAERGGWLGSRRVSGEPSTKLRVIVPVRLVAAVIGLVLIVIAALAAGGGRVGPVPTTGPATPSTLSVAASPTPTRSALAAPLGYGGPGVIEFTRHGASGADDLWLIDPAGTNERLLVPGGCCGLFSPDGTLLAAAVPNGGLVERGKGLLGVNRYDLAGNLQGAIPGDCGACGISLLNSAPDTWSSDGRVAFDIWSDSDPTQDGMAIAGPPSWLIGSTALGPPEGHRDLPIAFSPDGTKLLFMREETTDGPSSIGPLFLLTIADRSARLVTLPGMSVVTNGLVQGPASWSPDGKTIAFAATGAGPSSGASIYLTTSTPGAKPVSIVEDAKGATSAHFSPDGLWIAYDVPGRSGYRDLHVVHPDGTGDRNLSAGFDTGVCCGQWSPDGQAILATGTSSDDTHYDLFIVPMSGDIRQVTQSPNTYTAFLWAPVHP